MPPWSGERISNCSVKWLNLTKSHQIKILYCVDINIVNGLLFAPRTGLHIVSKKGNQAHPFISNYVSGIVQTHH